MKLFNLNEYLADPSKKLVTRAGKKARIICTDKKGNDYPIVALIEEIYGESYVSYTASGKAAVVSDSRDLFFASEKKEGWINIYCNSNYYGRTIGNLTIYNSEKDAKNAKDVIGGNTNYITTVKIEWEE